MPRRAPLLIRRLRRADATALSPVPRRTVLAAVLLSGVLSGCSPPSGAPADANADGNATGDPSGDPLKERGRAHEESFAALRPLALKALGFADPLRRAQLDPSGLPRISLADTEWRAKRQEALESASREADEIDSVALMPLSRVLLRTTRFALDRARDQLLRHPPEATDPAWKYEQAFALIDLYDQRQLEGAPVDLAALLTALSADLSVLSGDGRAASSAGLQHARRESLALRRALALRVDALVASDADPAGREALVAAMAKFSESISALQSLELERMDTLSEFPQGQWSADSTARLGVAFQQLPDAMSRPTIERMLAVEEGIGADVPRLAAEVDAALTRMEVLVNATRSNPRVVTSPAKVTVERCEERWKALLEQLPAELALRESAELDCVRFVSLETLRARQATPEIPSAPNLPDGFAWYADEDELVLALLDRGLTDRTRAASERGTDPLLGIVASTAGAGAQRHLSRISLAHVLAEWGALDRASRLARHDLCMAGFSLRVHAEFGSAEERVAWLAARCPEVDATTLLESVVEAPRTSLRGLSFALLGTEPFRLTARDLNWWLPHGLLDVVGDPVRTLNTPGAPRPAGQGSAAASGGEETPMLKNVDLDPAEEGSEAGAAAPAPSDIKAVEREGTGP